MNTTTLYEQHSSNGWFLTWIHVSLSVVRFLDRTGFAMKNNALVILQIAYK
jgi:hypothetical protein